MSTAFRPASVPLITVDPYFSIWSPADRLTDAHTVHWTGKRNSMCGLIRIDDQAYRFMGGIGLADTDLPELEATPAMEQTSLNVDPLTTTYTFTAGGIALDVQFTTPLLLDDLELLSRPVTYISFRGRSTDGAPHRVKLYLDLSGEACVHAADQAVSWSRKLIGDTIAALSMGTEDQPILARVGDDTRIDWGYAYLAVRQSEQVETAIGASAMRQHFAQQGSLPEHEETGISRSISDNWPVMATAIDLGVVESQPSSAYVAAAYDDILSIEYFGAPLQAYWRRSGQSFEDMLVSAMRDYDAIQARCEAFNRRLKQDSQQAGGAKYADLLSLAYRQAIAAHKLVSDRDGSVLFFSKENFSNGCIATVDVSYPSIPLFLLYNPELVKGMMRPIFRYAASEDWTFDFAPHDVGCYPKANGQVYGENKLEFQMPIEECGNMLLMAAAVCAYERNGDFAREHWDLLTKWAGYLSAHGLDPDNQLCTDDFAGHLAHNANLSIKAIAGIGAYALLCDMIGEQEADTYRQAAKQMAEQWVVMAKAGDHYKLTFDSSPESWSLKYNLVWDRLLDLKLFPCEIAEAEVAHYIARQNVYGTPLDSRNSYTKSDWLVWSATLAKSQAEFETLIAPLWLAQHETESRVPFTDWYDTVTGKQIGFQNRSVVGGLFIALLQPVSAIVASSR
ncbi:hypothetical protein FHS18_003742 [Paenibacillus phyllosphaerae]|uniref:Glutaminase n=1 Tax=Paenibacillus phyllosphaerae TaxID=274593 RepID=A0A7W5FP46_9BACL|nr:glutaminase family protein [Paenibacillus phyllosphaerae]MBB3111674.1 hypothetical protein [Paenibacillus phyllosphaerae]